MNGMNDDDQTSSGLDEDVENLFLEEHQGTPPEPWRDTAQSWSEIFRFLYDEDTKYSVAASSCLAINKDISFIVGGDEVVLAHSFVLQMRSGFFNRKIKTVFDEALKGKWSYRDEEGHQLWDLKPLPIPISLADADTFKAVLKFMYIEEIDEGSSDEKLVQLIAASKKFEVRLMERKCKAMLGKRLKPENAAAIFQVAEKYKNERLMGRCFDIMLQSGQNLFTGTDFVNLSHSLLCKLLPSNELNVSEIDIFQNTIRWAREQLKKSNLPETGENLRKVLNPAHLYIRFPLLPKRFITEDVRNLGILDDVEINELALFFLIHDAGNLKNFRSDPRRYQEPVIQQSQTTIQNHIQTPSAVTTPPPTISQQQQRPRRPSSQANNPPQVAAAANLISRRRHSNSDTPSTQAGEKCMGATATVHRRRQSTENNNNSNSADDKIKTTTAHQVPSSSKSAPSSSAAGEVIPKQQPPLPSAHHIDILDSSCNEQEEDGQVKKATPQTSQPMPPRTTRRSTSLDQSTIQKNEDMMEMENKPKDGNVQGGSLGDRKRKLSSSTTSETSQPASKRATEGCDKILALTGSLDKVLTNDDVINRLKVALENQQIDGLDKVAKIVLTNVLLPKRRNAIPSIIVPNINCIEILFDNTTESKHCHEIHPDDYLIFGSVPGAEILLDKGLWQNNTRISIWDKGIRRFELNPKEKSFFVNLDNPSIASHVVKRLGVDLEEEEDNLIKKLALYSTPVHSKLNPTKLTHLVIHRCDLERTDVFRDCVCLERMSWIGIYEKDVLDLSHLANSAATLTSLALSNIKIKVDKGMVPTLKALNNLDLIMCSWGQNFEEQFGVFCPNIKRLFITAFHNFIPSNTMALAFLTQMKSIEAVLITFAPPLAVTCMERIELGNRFLELLESTATCVNVTASNLSSISIPANGFRLRRMNGKWHFAKLPSSISQTSPRPGLVDKEYFDYFLLNVFAKNVVAYLSETTLKCEHKDVVNQKCGGRYFHQGNILALCLHDQHLIESTPICCNNTSILASSSSHSTSMSHQRHEVYSPAEVSLNSPDLPNQCSGGASCERASSSVCGCSSCVERSTPPSSSPASCSSLPRSQVSRSSKSGTSRNNRRNRKSSSSHTVVRSSSSGSSHSPSPVVIRRKKSSPVKRKKIKTNVRSKSSGSNQGTVINICNSSSSNESFNNDSNSGYSSSSSSDNVSVRSMSVSPPITRSRAQKRGPIRQSLSSTSTSSSSDSDDDDTISSRSQSNSPPKRLVRTRLRTASRLLRPSLRPSLRPRLRKTSNSSVECISIVDKHSSNDDDAPLIIRTRTNRTEPR